MTESKRGVDEAAVIDTVTEADVSGRRDTVAVSVIIFDRTECQGISSTPK